MKSIPGSDVTWEEIKLFAFGLTFKKQEAYCSRQVRNKDVDFSARIGYEVRFLSLNWSHQPHGEMVAA